MSALLVLLGLAALDYRLERGRVADMARIEAHANGESS